jgi:hypothetical protein
MYRSSFDAWRVTPRGVATILSSTPQSVNQRGVRVKFDAARQSEAVET